MVKSPTYNTLLFLSSLALHCVMHVCRYQHVYHHRHTTNTRIIIDTPLHVRRKPKVPVPIFTHVTRYSKPLSFLVQRAPYAPYVPCDVLRVHSHLLLVAQAAAQLLAHDGGQCAHAALLIDM